MALIDAEKQFRDVENDMKILLEAAQILRKAALAWKPENSQAVLKG